MRPHRFRARVPARSVIVERRLLTHAVAERLEQSGYTTDAARITAEHFVQAEAEDCRSHGLRLIPVYLDEVKAGRVSPNVRAKMLSDEGAAVVWDGQMSPGHLALSELLEECIRRARQYGVAVGWISRLAHTGRLGDYISQATDVGLSGFLTVASALDPESALVAPPGSVRRLLGSNPVAIGVASKATSPLCFDASTAAMPYYELARYHESGQKLPSAAIVDSRGRPSRDPENFYSGGAILPLGRHRGFGLSMALALLAQLRCPQTAAGGTNAFVLLTGTHDQAGESLAQTLRSLLEQGAYVPGSRRPDAQRKTEIEVDEATLTLLRGAGVVLP